MIYWIVFYLTKVVSGIFFPVRVFGRENIPRQGSFILASNHVSNLDPVVLAIAQHRRISFMAKDSLFKNKFLGWILPKLDAFPIRRGSSDVRSLREAIRRIKKGAPLMMFPEGTRGAILAADHVDEVAEAGVGFLVAKADVPIIPAYVKDSDKAMPPQARYIKRHTITIFIGKPLTFSKTAPYPQIAQEVMRQIMSLAPA